MKNMFVHYSGTLAAFKEAKEEGVLLSAKYHDSIVFIKGGENGNGSAVYTHGNYYGDVKDALAALSSRVDGLKYFSKLSDGSSVAEVASANGVISITGEDPAVTTHVDPTGIKVGLSEAFKTQVNETLPANIQAVSDKLGEKGAAAATGADATAFGRIKNLETVVAGLTGSEGGEVESVDAKVTKAINTLDVDAKEGDFVASISQVDGKIAPVMGAFNFDTKGAAAAAESAAKAHAETKATEAKDAAIAYADGKFQVAGNYEAAGAAAEALASAKKYADDLDTAMNTRVEALEAIDHAKLATDAAASAVATVLDGAPEKFDTLKEVAEWIADSESAATAADLVTRVGALEAIDHEAYVAADTALETSLKGYVDDRFTNEVTGKFDTVGSAEAAEKNAKEYADGKDSAMHTRVDALETAKTELVAADEANAAAIETEKGRVDAIVADYLKAADKTELQGNIDAVSAVANAAATKADTYTKAEVDAMWAWEEL